MHLMTYTSSHLALRLDYEDDAILITTREGSLRVPNLCEGSSMNSSIPKHLGRGSWYKAIA